MILGCLLDCLQNSVMLSVLIRNASQKFLSVRMRCRTLRRKTVGRQVTLSTNVSRMSISSNNHLVDNFFVGATNG